MPPERGAVSESSIHEGSNDDSTTSSPVASPQHLQLESHHRARHLAVVILGTLWWYIYGTVTILTKPVNLFGLSTALIDTCAIFITASQLLVYVLLWRLTNATTLRGGQFLVLGCITLCVPADILLVLFDPIDSEIATVYVFSVVTMIFGLYLPHYLKLAAMREDMASARDGNMDDMDEERVVVVVHDSHHDAMNNPKSGLHPRGPIGELIRYRPPTGIQSFHLAISFTRSFVSFTLAVIGFREASLGEGFFTVAFLVSCTLIAFHNAIEMTLTNLFPGVALKKYRSFLIFDAIFFLLDMVSSLVIARSDGIGDSVWDDVLNSYLFWKCHCRVF